MHWPWPSLSAAAILLVFLGLEIALLQWLPGKTFAGPITPAGDRPHYKLNGIAAWIVTQAWFIGGSFGLHLFKAGLVWDHFGEILSTLVLFALVFCLGLYFKGRERFYDRLGPAARPHPRSLYDRRWQGA